MAGLAAFLLSFRPGEQMTDGFNRPIATNLPIDVEGDRARKKTAHAASIATYMHELSKRQREHLRHPMMANHALDMLLTLYIAAEDKSRPTLSSLAAANALDPEQAESVLEQLVKNGFADWRDMHALGGPRMAMISQNGRERVEALARSIASL